MLKTFIGGAGCGKSYNLIKELCKLAQKNNKKIIYIVPEQFSFEADKKLYKALGPEKFNNILSVSFTSLAKEIFEKFGGRPGEYADDIQKFILMNMAVKKVMEADSLNYYKKQAGRTGFVNEALAVVNEFRQCGITPDRLMNICSTNTEYNEKISALSALYTAYDEMLQAADLKDSLTDISNAAAIAQGSDYFKDAYIFFDEFESFTGDQYELIDVMFSQASAVYIALRYTAGTTDTEQRDNNVFHAGMKTYAGFLELAKKYNKKHEFGKIGSLSQKYKSPSIAYLNSHIFTSINDTYDHATDISVVSCCDLYEEAEYVAAQIRELVMKEGYKYKEIAVLSRQLDEYAYIFDAVMKKYDIPYFLDAKKSASRTSIMQFMISTINLISESSPSLDTVLTFLKTVPKPLPYYKIDTLEKYSFEWNLKGRDFLKPFVIDIEKRPYIEEFRKELIGPVISLREKCQDSKCSDICRYIFEFLDETNINGGLTYLTNSLIENSDLYILEAKEQKRVWDSLMKMLETFADICGDIDIAEFGRLWKVTAENIKFSTPPQTLDSVHIARAETARPASPKVVFIIGVNEGRFPAAVSNTGLLNDKDRAIFEQAKIHLSRSAEELIADERLVTYKSLTYPSEKLYVTYPKSDISGADRFPSSLITEICQLFSKPVTISAADKVFLFYATTEKAAYSHFVRNFDSNSQQVKDVKAVLSENEEYRTKLEYFYKVMQQKNFKIDDTDLIKKLYGDNKFKISPTSFEMYHRCPFRFFCKTGLRLYKPERNEIKKLQTGNIVHDVLEKILAQNNKTQFLALDEQAITGIIDSVTDEFMTNKMGGDAARTKRTNAILDEIKKNILQIVFHLQKEFGQSDFDSVEFECQLDENNTPVIRTKDGIEIHLEGKVDRIDVFTDKNTNKKYIRVVDYKTGTTKFDLGSVKYGVSMQMLLYMFALVGRHGKYEKYKPAGVLYQPLKEMDYNNQKANSVEKYLDSCYKMDGIVLHNQIVLDAMEKGIKGVFIPAKYTKANELDKNSIKSCLDSRAFKRLRRHTVDLLIQLTEQLYNGNIQADPLSVDDKTSCSYCDYWSICGNADNSTRKVLKNAKEDMLEKLKED